MDKEKVLEVKDLTVKIGEKNVLSSINMTAYKGRVLGIIGESGSGKTMLCHAMMQTLPSLAQLHKVKFYIDKKIYWL
ncbi:ABC transporter ATP-binding protein OS=Lysinibacillus sphaericus OX=1421 GN=LS41612_12295 PE=3 SV=1 [Lysinibacillus sphaericus]